MDLPIFDKEHDLVNNPGNCPRTELTNLKTNLTNLKVVVSLTKFQYHL